jgi:hypothetical protein
MEELRKKIGQVDIDYIGVKNALTLLLQYQEQTKYIVEELIKDIRELRLQSESVPVLTSRLSSLEVKVTEILVECKNRNSFCAERMAKIFNEFRSDRSNDNEKWHEFEKKCIIANTELKELIEEKLMSLLEKKDEIYKNEMKDINVKIGNLVEKTNGFDKTLHITISKIGTAIVIVGYILNTIGGKLFSHFIEHIPK